MRSTVQILFLIFRIRIIFSKIEDFNCMSGRLVHEIIERARDHFPILFWVSSLNLIQRHIFKSSFLFKKGGMS